MDNVVTKKALKRFFPAVMMLCFCAFMLTGCEEPPNFQIRRQAKKIMKCIANKDKEGLFEYFAQDRRTERKEETMKEINFAFYSVIDGNIVSYKYERDGGGDGQDYGVINYYYRFPTFCNIKTDTGKTYKIVISYYHIWRDHPEFEGIRYIDIYDDYDSDSDKHLLYTIGGEFDSKTDQCDGLWK